MTNEETRLEEEIRTVLGSRGLSGEERHAMVEEALRAAKEPGAAAPRVKRRRRLALLLLPAAVAAGVLLVLRLGAPAPRAPCPVAASPAAVAEARPANEAALAAPAAKAALAGARRGLFAVAAGGEFVGIDPDLPKLLAAAEEAAPGAAHRFVFRVGSEGEADRGLLTGQGDRVAGMALLEAAGLKMTVGPDGTEFAANGKSLGRGPGGPPEVPVGVGEPGRTDGATFDFPVSTAFRGALVLPAGVTFPRFEIPGFARVRNAAGLEVRYRRYLVRVRIEELGVDLLAEALGSPGLADPAWTDAAGVRWRTVAGLRWCEDYDAARAESKRTGRPLLLLFGDAGPVPPRPFEDETVRCLLDGFVLLCFFVPTESEWERAATGALPLPAGGPSLLTLYPAEGGPSNFRIGSQLHLEPEPVKEALQTWLLREILKSMAGKEAVVIPSPVSSGRVSVEALRRLRELLVDAEAEATDPAAKAELRRLIEAFRTVLPPEDGGPR